MNNSARILISGAGVAGLTAAIALGRAGFKPVIVERANDVRADGYIISLSHRSYQFAEKLGLLPEIHKRLAGVTASSYHRADKTLLTLDYERLFEGVRVVQIMRDDLQDILYEKARDLAEFRFGNSISHFGSAKAAQEVHFSDGGSEEFDLIIGADGLHSTVRELGFADAKIERRHLGLCSAAYRLPNIAGLSHKFETHMERDRYMVIFTTPQNGLAAVFVWAGDMERGPEPARRQQTLLAAYDNSNELVQKVLDHCPPDGAFFMDPLIQIRMDSWHRPHMVLTGDAAHCLTLISGQGATMAFTGACVLSEHLINKPLDEALNAYETELKTTTRAVQNRTRSISRWYVPRSTIRQNFRDTAMRLFPTRYFEQHFKTKYSRA